MQHTIKSRTLGKDITFSRPGSGYVYADLNGKAGTLGRQICKGGRVTGATLSYYGETEEGFKSFCRIWYRLYLRNIKKEAAV